jgi:hypothetical protein
MRKIALVLVGFVALVTAHGGGSVSSKKQGNNGETLKLVNLEAVRKPFDYENHLAEFDGTGKPIHQTPPVILLFKWRRLSDDFGEICRSLIQD